MRKPRRLSADELAGFQLDLPAASPTRKPDPDAPPPEPLDWPAVFGNDRPVEIEVGFGKGLFLVNTAAARPDRNFLGIEIVRKYQLYATARLAVRDLANARTVVCGRQGGVPPLRPVRVGGRRSRLLPGPVVEDPA